MEVSVTVYAYTKDLDRMRRFYREALGVAPAEHGDWLPFDLDAGTFALHGVPEGGDRDVSGFQLSFGVDDIEAAVARFREQGASVVREIETQEYGKNATLRDLDGRAFDLVQHA